MFLLLTHFAGIFYQFLFDSTQKMNVYSAFASGRNIEENVTGKT